MARNQRRGSGRGTSNTSRARSTSARRTTTTVMRYRKSDAEARVERITWALLVMVFALLYLVPETAALPNWVIPVAGAMILLGSGLYQYTRGWRVSPITWLAGAAMFAIGFYGLYVDPQRDLLSFSLFVFAVVIAIGIVTGET